VIWDAEALVANKSSAICLYVGNGFQRRIWVEINITYNFGTQAFLETGPYGNGTPIDPGFNKVYIPGGPVLNAYPTAWEISPNKPKYLIWTKTGLDDKIKATIDPLNKISEENETNNEITTEMKVVETRQLRILVVPVYFPQLLQTPFIPNTYEQKEFLLATYPVAENKFSWETSPPIPWPGIPPFPLDPNNDIEQLLLIIWLYTHVALPISVTAQALGYDRAVIVILNVTQRWAGIAIGNIWGNRIPVIVVNEYLPLAEDLVAHEIGHTFDLWHPHDNGPPVYSAIRFWVTKKDYEKLASTFMSYRHKLPPGIPPDIRWIDKGRFDTDNNWNATARVWQRNLLDQLRMSEDPEIIVISGVIFKNSTAKAEEPWYILPEGNPNLMPSNLGNFSVVLLDEEDQIIAEMKFNVTFQCTLDLNGTLVPIESDVFPFMFNIPYIPETHTIQIRNSTGHILISKEITPNAPSVNVSFPNGGESLLIGEIYNITWSAFDSDNDPLTFTVAYSNDNGENWIPLAFNITDNFYEWNTSGLTSGEYLIKIIATDGVNTAHDISDSTFTLISPAIHDISITNVSFSNPKPKINETVTISVTIVNLGNCTETFCVSVNYTRLRDPLIGTQPVTLIPNESITLNFTWTPNIAGRYRILAYTSEIPEDINPNNNKMEIIVYIGSQTTLGGASSSGFRKCFLR